MFGKENQPPAQNKAEDQEMKSEQTPTFLGILSSVFDQMVVEEQ